jgi:S1-C subfamily serine protease
MRFLSAMHNLKAMLAIVLLILGIRYMFTIEQHTATVIPEKIPLYKHFPYSSFVQLDLVGLAAVECEPGEAQPCISEAIYGNASGVAVGDHQILTAGHVCRRAQEYGIQIVATDDLGMVTVAQVDRVDDLADLCLLTTEKMVGPPVALATRKPSRGERLYNLAAPRGIFSPGLILTFDGFMIGQTDDEVVYTMPSEPGSSGSPIVNSKGELVGIVCRTSTEMSGITMGPRFSDVMSFLNSPGLILTP